MSFEASSDENERSGLYCSVNVRMTRGSIVYEVSACLFIIYIHFIKLFVALRLLLFIFFVQSSNHKIICLLNRSIIMYCDVNRQCIFAYDVGDN